MFSFWRSQPKVSPSEGTGEADINAGWNDGDPTAATSRDRETAKAAHSAPVRSPPTATTPQQPAFPSSSSQRPPSATSPASQQPSKGPQYPVISSSEPPPSFSAKAHASSMTTFARSALPTAATTPPSQQAAASATNTAAAAQILDPTKATQDLLSPAEIERLKEAGAPPMYLQLPAKLQDEGEAKPPEDIAMNWADMFWFRDVPEWYAKACLTGAVGCTYSVFKAMLDWKETEIYMPPRSKILPYTMRNGYVRTQKIKVAGKKVASQTVTMMCAGAAYFGGAFYLGRYREQHTWENFGAGGALAGVGVSLWIIRPWKFRTTLFGALLGGAGGALAAKMQSDLGFPFWEDEERDFRGYWFAKWIDLRRDRALRREQEALERAQAAGGAGSSAGSSAGSLEAAEAEGAGSRGGGPVLGRRWATG